MMWPFTSKPKQQPDVINRNYICMGLDPIHTMNDLRVGDWNLDKVRDGLMSGMLRYAKQSEVDEAISIGRISNVASE